MPKTLFSAMPRACARHWPKHVFVLCFCRHSPSMFRTPVQIWFAPSMQNTLVGICLVLAMTKTKQQISIRVRNMVRTTHILTNIRTMPRWLGYGMAWRWRGTRMAWLWRGVAVRDCRPCGSNVGCEPRVGCPRLVAAAPSLTEGWCLRAPKHRITHTTYTPTNSTTNTRSNGAPPWKRSQSARLSR